MCGIVGVVARSPVNQVLYDGLLVLQHRGQDAAGIVTADGSSFHMHKGGGMVRDVFRTRNMRSLAGFAGIAGCGNRLGRGCGFRFRLRLGQRDRRGLLRSFLHFFDFG